LKTISSFIVVELSWKSLIDDRCNSYDTYRPAIISGGSDKVVTEDTVINVETNQVTVDEQTVEKAVAPLFSQPATIITIDTEACTHEVWHLTMYICRLSLNIKSYLFG